MNKLSIGMDEGIILQAEDVFWYSEADDKSVNLNELILTNKYLYMNYEKSNGLFSKKTNETIKKPLSDIKIINDQPMVNEIKNDYGYYLQIQFVQGRDHFNFGEGTRETIYNWVNELYKTLVGTEAPESAKPSTISRVLGGLGGDIGENIGESLGSFAASFKNVAGTAMQSLSSTAKQVAEQASNAYENKRQQIQNNIREQEQTQKMIERMYSESSNITSNVKFCSNCGTKLDPGAKFCPNCGVQIGADSLPSVPPVPVAAPQNPVVRQQEFAGELLKCPNCGAPISQTTAVCPECGYRITGKAAVTSVQSFSNQLMLLESRRKAGGLGQAIGWTANPVDKQKLSLIQSFPIPNTIDDIQEFMILAMSNIDVSVSKKSMWNSYQTAGARGYGGQAIIKDISDAWVAKMQQAYRKASIAFPNDPSFAYIKQLYIEKMAELKMKVED